MGPKQRLASGSVSVLKRAMASLMSDSNVAHLTRSSPSSCTTVSMSIDQSAWYGIHWLAMACARLMRSSILLKGLASSSTVSLLSSDR